MNTLFQILFVPIFLLVFYVGGLFVLGTDKLRVDHDCEVQDFFGGIEEFVLGDRFWRAQIEQIDKRTIKLEEEYVKWEKANQFKIIAKASIMPPGYKTPAEEEAFALRVEADRIEREEKRRKDESAQLTAIQLLKSCRIKIEKLLQHQQ